MSSNYDHEAHGSPEREHWPEPQIWIASLADYNNGHLRGAWIDATQDPEDLHAATQRILSESQEPGAEEWAIHDYDGFGPEFHSAGQISH